MGQVLIRNIDDQLLDRYRAVARAEGRSLEQTLRDALARAAPAGGEPAEVLKALSQSLRARTPPQAREDSTAAIRRDRDSLGGRLLGVGGEA